eukprot:TRINITY_DN3368_c0_g1_i1.p3 TRINITY_DN3368_c0_g1~~TRINITY_DN3368_c0_g1_i1.p3  ORF type:complete len:146 (-),score=2.85 TRINITY_DN3368_c0_g1_i1:348-785(-)
MSIPLSPQPIPGLPIRPPLMMPQHGQVIVGYQRRRYPADCCNCEGLNETALIWIVVLFVLGLMFIFPLFFMWIPLVVDDCRKEYQIPVYGFPANPQSQPQPQYVAQPAQQYTAAVAPTAFAQPAPQYEAAVGSAPYTQPAEATKF